MWSGSRGPCLLAFLLSVLARAEYSNDLKGNINKRSTPIEIDDPAATLGSLDQINTEISRVNDPEILQGPSPAIQEELAVVGDAAKNAYTYTPPSGTREIAEGARIGPSPVIVDESYIPDYIPSDPNIIANGQLHNSVPPVVIIEGVRSIEVGNLVQPYKTIPGAANVIQCTWEGEMMTVIVSQGCLICACVNQYGVLAPVCASCSSCSMASPPFPISTLPPTVPITENPYIPYPNNFPTTPGPTQFPPYPPYTTPHSPPTPTPYPVITERPPPSCAPIPPNTPYENPLNPCQICICIQDLTAEGLNVRITCQDSQQCEKPLPIIVPSNSTPSPFPPCDVMPKDILFPHPTETCRICKCILEMSFNNYPENQIVCVPNPNCGYPDVTTTLLPPIFPTVPTTPPQRRFPNNPLPGPPPQESCQPYTPNVPFNHPWDVCLTCTCYEARSAGHVTIQVNCETKQECCIVDNGAVVPVPADNAKSQLQIVDSICTFKTFSVEFPHPKDPCRVCSCQVYGKFVIPSCKRARPDCPATGGIPQQSLVFLEPKCKFHPPNQKFIAGCNMCVCYPVSQFVIASCEVIPNCNPLGNHPTIATTPQYLPQYQQQRQQDQQQQAWASANTGYGNR